jgi:hypothetical protein
MPDFGSYLPFRLLKTWQPGCWCVAMIELCEPHSAVLVGETFHYPEQWAYFLWPPRDEAKPFSTPAGWGVTGAPPYPEIYLEVGSAPLLRLPDNEVDEVSALEWLLIVDEPPAWLRLRIEAKLQQARRAREQRLWRELGSPDALAFRRFRQRVLCGDGKDDAGAMTGAPS